MSAAPPGTVLWQLPAGDARPSLERDTEADVVIVGGGFTGLWTAWYLAERRPDWRVVVLEADVVGAGASGRNGGWCSALLPMSLASIATAHGRAAAHRAQAAMDHTVDEIGAVVAALRIDCHFTKGGSLDVARSPVQAARLRAGVAAHQRFGFGDDDVRWLAADDAAQRVGAGHVHGAAFTRQCAALDPARLVDGLATAAEGRGVTIHERSPVEHIERGRVRTARHVVRTRFTVRATEAFSVGLRGLRRSVVPIYSLMIATEPLGEATLAGVGLAGRETFTDGRRLVIYGQRTADGRIAFGGRGAPYHFASRMRPAYSVDDRVHDRLRATLVDLLPALEGVAITHRWGGAVAAARDWWCSIGLDRGNGLAWAGGYVGDGVATANLAGRTLTDLLTGERSALCELPWVDHHSRQWEREPLRWLGINAMVRLADRADRHEARTGRPDRWRGALIERVTNQ